MSHAAAITAAFNSALALRGRDVTYSDGSNVVAVKAVPGQTEFDTLDATGSVVAYRSSDWLVKASDLGAIVPAKGHTITDGAKTYEVTFPGGGRVYRESDREGVTLRIHSTLRSDLAA